MKMTNHLDITSLAKSNTYFRKNIIQNGTTEVTLQSVKSNIGFEVHADNDQLIFIVEGKAWAMINDELISNILPGHMLFIEAGTGHEIVNANNGC